MDLEKLFSTYKVLPPRPAWRAVEQALTEMESEGTDEESSSEKEERVAIVRQFASSLVERGETLSQAIACSAVLGRVAGDNEPGTWIETGLDAIAAGANFRDSSSETVRQVIAALYESRLSKPGVFEKIGQPAKLAPDNVEAWRHWLENLTAVLSGEPVWTPTELTEARARAWQQAHARLLGYLQLSSPPKSAVAALVEPSIDHLLCAAAKMTPASRISIRPESMTLGNWSDLVYFALRDSEPGNPDYCPTWVAFIAGHQLGIPGLEHSLLDSFDARRGEIYSARPADDPQERDALEKCREVLSKLEHTIDYEQLEPLLILRPQEHSISAQWAGTPTPVAATLTLPQLKQLRHLWLNQQREAVLIHDIRDIVIEIPEGSGPDSEQLQPDAALSLLDDAASYANVYCMYASADAVDKHGYTQYPPVVGPRDLQDLRRQITFHKGDMKS